MGKVRKGGINEEVNTDKRSSEQINPCHNISGIDLEIDDQISDAIAIARTAKARSIDAENEGSEVSCSEALSLILYRSEQIRESHALIVKRAPY